MSCKGTISVSAPNAKADLLLRRSIDLYDGSGYTQGRQIIWSSGTLLYGVHNVTLTQLGPDARFG